MPSSNKKPDVTKPGKSAPNATARPIITGHKMMQNDPMMGANRIIDATKDKLAEEKIAETPHVEKIVQPPSSETAEPPKPADPIPEKAKEPLTSSTQKQEATSAKKEMPPVAEQQPVSNDAAVIDAVAEQANKKPGGEMSAEEKKHQEEIQKLIEEKKYFVPIKVASQKRNTRANIIVLALLVLFIGVFVAADVGALKLPFATPFHIFKQQNSVANESAPTAAPKTTPVVKTTTYEDKASGLSFTYPKDWGEVLATKGLYPTSEKGTIYRYIFSANPTLFGTMRSTDYLTGRDTFTIYPTGSSNYNEAVKTLDSIDALRGKPVPRGQVSPGNAIITENNDWMIIVSLCTEACKVKDNLTVGVLRKLNNKTFQSISFAYEETFKTSAEAATPGAFINLSNDVIIKKLDQTKLKQLEALAASIKG